MMAHDGKAIVTGMGKSDHVARQLVATLCSTGTPAVFMHPAEAIHGDLGIYSEGDPTVPISKSEATAELTRLVPILREFGSPLIGILGDVASPLASQVDVLLDASVEREADPHNLVPTASTVVALALGHSLAVALMTARNFTLEEFSRYHPGSQLGRSLRLKVVEVMHDADEVAWARQSSGLSDASDDPTDGAPVGGRLHARQ
jgi:arabinose-5-phosphate isomerase